MLLTAVNHITVSDQWHINMQRCYSGPVQAA